MKDHARRLKPRCPYFGKCGGCQWQDIPYEIQLFKKESFVRNMLTGLLHIPKEVVQPIIGTKEIWFYRNKMQLPVRMMNNRILMGYFISGSHDVINIKECYIQDPYLTESAQIAREVFEREDLSAYDEKTGKGLLRHFVGKIGFQTNEILLGIVINSKKLPSQFTVANEIKKRERLMIRNVARKEEYPVRKPKQRIAGIVLNENSSNSNVIMGTKNTTLFGRNHINEKLGNFLFKNRLDSFFQVNPKQAFKLYNQVRDFAALTGSETVIDAYCGVGPIALWLSDKAQEIIGIERNENAIKDARQNAGLNQINNVRFEMGEIEKALPAIKRKIDLIVVNPPRKGCEMKTLTAILKAKPSKVIYVSCNPNSLARDAKVLQERYKLKAVRPVDMFPQTYHVESVSLFEL
jgi:23S rRNA (uracil1939-C5)-methyltransferase